MCCCKRPLSRMYWQAFPRKTRVSCHKTTMKVSSPSRCSVRCRLKSPAAIVSRQLTNANDTKAAITANMPYPNDWSAETVAALISGLLGTSTAENKSFGDASIDSNTEQNFAVIHRQSRKKNCIRLFWKLCRIWPQTLPMKLLHNLTVFSVKWKQEKTWKPSFKSS